VNSQELTEERLQTVVNSAIAGLRQSMRERERGAGSQAGGKENLKLRRRGQEEVLSLKEVIARRTARAKTQAVVP
jgi:hypothetical protein